MQEYFTSVSDLLTGSQSHHIFLEVLLKLTEKEKDALVRDFEPEPLVTEVFSSHPALKSRVVRGKASQYVNVDGVDCINFATHNFLGFIGDEKIEEKAIKSVEKYGVGSCGPRGFYGTSEVHLALEKQLADFMGTEDAVVYSYAFSTISSAIPAYAKRGDIVFVDEKANYAIQKGLDASRSMIKYFNHNDIDHLTRILEETKQADLKNIQKAERSRRFLIIEGIYANSGQICPLPQLVEIAQKYKLRTFIDESLSFGVLGKTGRGVTEHFNIPISEVDMVMASLENSLASIGGFCVGSSFVVDHQRLSGLGYCFSASLPPLLVIAAMEGLKCIDERPEMLGRLRKLCHETHDQLHASSALTQHFVISGDRDSPVHLLLLRPDPAVTNRQAVISDIADYCLQSKTAICRASYLEREDTAKPTECLRVTTSLFHTQEAISGLVTTLESACLDKLGST